MLDLDTHAFENRTHKTSRRCGMVQSTKDPRGNAPDHSKVVLLLVDVINCLDFADSRPAQVSLVAFNVQLRGFWSPRSP